MVILPMIRKGMIFPCPSHTLYWFTFFSIGMCTFYNLKVSKRKENTQKIIFLLTLVCRVPKEKEEERGKENRRKKWVRDWIYKWSYPGILPWISCGRKTPRSTPDGHTPCLPKENKWNIWLLVYGLVHSSPSNPHPLSFFC